MTIPRENRVARNTLFVHGSDCGKIFHWVVVKSIGYTRRKLGESIRPHPPGKPIKVGSRLTSERTYGGEGRKYAGSSGERGREVEMSIRVVASLNVREIVTASRGLSVDAKGSESWYGKESFSVF